MTDSAFPTVAQASTLGEALARRLPNPEGDSSRFALAAGQALPQMLADVPPATAAALHELVLLPEFAAFLAPSDHCSPASPAVNPERQVLIERCQQIFPSELLPTLLAFSDSYRTTTLASRMAADRKQPAGVLANLAGLALAIPLCLVIGWLGHRWLNLQANKFTGAPIAQDALLNPPAPAPANPGQGQPKSLPRATKAVSGAVPACLQDTQNETSAPADPSNYDRRESVNWKGEPVPSSPQLIVLHETVVDEAAALALFQRRNIADANQASYHVLIGRDGRRIRVVNDDQRAFGAGDSAWQGFSVQLRQSVPASVNNIALHVSLVSPPDGADGEARGHSGYTAEQYRSLATQIARWQSLYSIPADRIVTHEAVDRSGTRRDPRSLNWDALRQNLQHTPLACSSSAPTSGQPAPPAAPALPPRR